MVRTRFAFGQFGGATRRKGTLVLCLALGTLGVGLSVNGQERNARLITFDAPGVGTGQFQGTDPLAINAAGTVTGFCNDASDVGHGFVRAQGGPITSIDIPGAGTGSGQGTFANNINAPADITGQYVDANGVNHGFLRSKHGTITTFDITGAGDGSGQGTIPSCNNPADVVTGSYLDATGLSHGFLLIP